MSMRNLFSIALLITLSAVLFTNCRKSQSTNANERQALGSAPSRIVVIDDLDPNARNLPIVVDTSEIDTSDALIFDNNSIIRGNINITSEGYAIVDSTGQTFNINFSALIDTMNLQNVELYYAIPATMDSTAVKILIPRKYILRDSQGGSSGGGSGGRN